MSCVYCAGRAVVLIANGWALCPGCSAAAGGPNPSPRFRLFRWLPRWLFDDPDAWSLPELRETDQPGHFLTDIGGQPFMLVAGCSTVLDDGSMWDLCEDGWRPYQPAVHPHATPEPECGAAT